MKRLAFGPGPTYASPTLSRSRPAGADALVTNDLRWRQAGSKPQVLLLQDYAG